MRWTFVCLQRFKLVLCQICSIQLSPCVFLSTWNHHYTKRKDHFPLRASQWSKSSRWETLWWKPPKVFWVPHLWSLPHVNTLKTLGNELHQLIYFGVQGREPMLECLIAFCLFLQGGESHHLYKIYLWRVSSFVWLLSNVLFIRLLEFLRNTLRLMF
jgi:hypothetical protein